MTNLEQMPFATNGQKDQFRDTALRRERELLADIEALEMAVVHAAAIPGKDDAIKYAERVVGGGADPLAEIAKNNPGLYMRHVSDDMIINYT